MHLIELHTLYLVDIILGIKTNLEEQCCKHQNLRITCQTGHQTQWLRLKLHPCRWFESSALMDVANTPGPTNKHRKIEREGGLTSKAFYHKSVRRTTADSGSPNGHKWQHQSDFFLSSFARLVHPIFDDELCLQMEIRRTKVSDRVLMGAAGSLAFLIVVGTKAGRGREGKRGSVGVLFVTSDTVVEENSDWSNAQPSKHSSVFSWLVLMEMFSASSCHCGSTYLEQLSKKWCQWVKHHQATLIRNINDP